MDLPGYPGGSDRVGNWVNQQFQLDAFGEVMQLLATAAGLDRLDRDAADALRVAVDIVGKHWDKPEAGIWELHDRRWTHSRLSCLAGLRRAAALPGAGRDLPHAAVLADAILARTSQTCTHPDGYWQRAPGRSASGCLSAAAAGTRSVTRRRPAYRRHAGGRSHAADG